MPVQPPPRPRIAALTHGLRRGGRDDQDEGEDDGLWDPLEASATTMSPWSEAGAGLSD